MSLDRIKTTVDLVSAFMVIIAAGVLIFTRSTSSVVRQDPPQQVLDVNGTIIDAHTIRHSIGSGKVALVEFSDYDCPFCARYEREAAPQVKKQLVDDGLLRLVEFNYPLRQIHATAEMAAEAAECAGRQGHYWEMHNALFSIGRTITDDDVARLTSVLGLDVPTFSQCRSREATAYVASDIAEARALGVRATPTFFVGVMTEAGSIRLLKQVVGTLTFERVRKLASEARKGTVP